MKGWKLKPCTEGLQTWRKKWGFYLRKIVNYVRRQCEVIKGKKWMGTERSD